MAAAASGPWRWRRRSRGAPCGESGAPPPRVPAAPCLGDAGRSGEGGAGARPSLVGTEPSSGVAVRTEAGWERRRFSVPLCVRRLNVSRSFFGSSARGRFCSSGISNAEARQPGKEPNFSVNWTVGDSGLEVINATTGKDEMGLASRLCKHALYSHWMHVHAKLSSSLRLKIFKPNLYHETKQGATEYQTAKECLFKAFLKAGLGTWVEKPIEQDQFSLTV